MTYRVEFPFEFGPEDVDVGDVLGLHGRADVAVLGPAVEVDLVAAEVHDVPDLGEVEELAVEALEDLVGVVVYGIELAAVGLAAVRGPGLLVHAEG